MKIKFTDKDPRRGEVFEIDDFRAREFIEAGQAVEFKGETVPENKAVSTAPENKSKGKK